MHLLQKNALHSTGLLQMQPIGGNFVGRIVYMVTQIHAVVRTI